MRILKLAAIFALAGFSAQAQSTADYPVAGATAAEEQPQEIIRETHGDWEIRCTTATNTCFLYQLMMNDEGTPVAEFSIVKLPLGSEAVAGATIVAPLGTLLTRGVIFAIDDADATQYPFSWCTRPGCFSRFGLTDLLIADMKSGSNVNIALYSIGNAQKAISITASLNGFTAAFDALENQTQ
jgi:invasion protein IalB